MQLAALQRFALCNKAAVDKTLKKYRKYVATASAKAAVVADLDVLKEVRQASQLDQRYPIYDCASCTLRALILLTCIPHDRASQFSHPLKLQNSLTCCSASSMARLRKLKNAAHDMEYIIMLESSEYHNYLSRLAGVEARGRHRHYDREWKAITPDGCTSFTISQTAPPSSLRAQHWADQETYKTQLREEQAAEEQKAVSALDRAVGVLAFDHSLKPTTLLILVVLLPLITLSITHTLSARITMPIGTDAMSDGVLTVFEVNGAWRQTEGSIGASVL
jgi:hypothetical protein